MLIRRISATALVPLCCMSFGQSSAPSFEVASIKLHAGQYTVVSSDISGPRIRIIAYPLLGLIMDAYGVEPDQVSGGPGWMSTDRYDIEALAPGDRAPNKEQLRLMLQSLLSERFHLQLHRESKVMPVYALVVGKGEPKLKPSAPDAVFSAKSSGARVGRYSVVKGTMAQLAQHLSSAPGVDRPVVDKTGLPGTYDYTLSWNFQTGPTDSEIPSIFTALQEQLGLKLESQKAPVEILAVDRAEKPSAN